MKNLEYKVTITMPKGDYLAKGDKYLQELIQDDLDIVEVGRWKVEVKELEENNESKIHTR